jgi:hypothetical protein
LVLPDIDQAQARFEEYEAEIYRRIEESKPGASHIGSSSGFVDGVYENNTGNKAKEM